MNLWRYLGITLILIGGLALIGSAKLPVLAFAQDKDKDKDKQVKDKDKGTEKDKDKGTEKDKGTAGKDKDTEKDKGAAGKDKDKKEEVKAVPGGDTKLVFKAFEAGKPFYTEQKTTTDQEMKVMQQTVKQKQSQTFIIEWTPKGKDKDGNWTVEQKIVGVKLEIDIGGNKINYDSTANNPKNPMTEFFQEMEKQTLTFTIAPDLTVKKVDGRDKFIQGLANINPQMKSLLNAILSEKALTRMAEPTWYAFPKDGVIPKDGKWERTSELDLGPIGKYETTFKFAYKGTDKDKAKIDIATTLKYSAPSDKAGLPFVIKDAKLTSESGTGEAIFDISKGRFDSSSLKMKLSGDLSIEVGNMTTVVNLTQDQTATSTTLDALPDAWKKAAPK
jgi:hypothetical protein